MNDEVRKAAERLRRVYGEESQWSVYDGHRDRASMLGSDERTIAKAYLAEHPEPDNRDVCGCCGQRIIKQAEPGVVP